MQLPREVLIGQNVALLVGKTLNRLGVHGRALVITGPKVRDVAAVTIVKSLEEADFATSTFITEGATTSNVEQVEKKPWSCRVADVDGQNIYLNAGSESGIPIGQKLMVLRAGKVIKDPSTGLVIGNAERSADE